MQPPTTKQLRDLLKTHKVSQTKAAEIALVSVSTFKRYIAGTSEMHPFVWIEFKKRVSQL